MNLVNMLLGITGMWAKVGDIATALVIKDPNKILPVYTTVIVSKNALDEHNDLKKIGFPNNQRTNVMLYFPAGNGANARHKTKIGTNYLHELKPNGITHNRKVKVIDYFDFKKLNDIVGFLQTEGAITFVVEDLKASEEFINNLCIFKQEFKNTVVRSHVNQNNKPSCDTDLLTTAITLYDLPYAIPVFNHNKAYGMGVNITMFWPEATKKSKELISSSEISFVVNKYSDNILYADGVKVVEPSFVDIGSIDYLSKVLHKEGARRKGLLHSAEHKVLHIDSE